MMVSRYPWIVIILYIGLSTLSGCSSSNIYSAREEFYQGNLEEAEKSIGTNSTAEGTNAILVLMERATILQADGKYRQSAEAIKKASYLERLLRTYSISQGAQSLLINDTVQDYTGPPFERTYMHNIAALDHLAVANFNDAGVEARRIIYSLNSDTRGNYPDDAFSRYLAGFIFEILNETDNSSIQYGIADSLAHNFHIDAKTGFIYQTGDSDYSPDSAVNSENSSNFQLIVFVLMGRSPTGMEMFNIKQSEKASAPYAKIYINGSYAGRSYPLTDIYFLTAETARIQILRRAAKTAARIAAKETIARKLDKEINGLGLLSRIILFGILERQDRRRWETLPRWMEVARISCKVPPESYEIQIAGCKKCNKKTVKITNPISRIGNKYISLFRDINHTD